jgi:hypothetical protein
MNTNNSRACHVSVPVFNPIVVVRCVRSLSSLQRWCTWCYQLLTVAYSTQKPGSSSCRVWTARFCIYNKGIMDGWVKGPATLSPGQPLSVCVSSFRLTGLSRAGLLELWDQGWWLPDHRSLREQVSNTLPYFSSLPTSEHARMPP